MSVTSTWQPWFSAHLDLGAHEAHNLEARAADGAEAHPEDLPDDVKVDATLPDGGAPAPDVLQQAEG